MVKAIIISNSLAAGGAERVTSELANSWSKYDETEVSLITYSSVKDFYKLNDSVIVHKLNYKQSSNLFSRLIGRFNVILKLRRQIRESNPDFILTMTVRVNVFTLISLLGLKQRIILSERNNPMDSPPLPLSICRRLFYRYAKGAIYQTQRAKDYFSSKHPSLTSIVLPNPINVVSIPNNLNKEKVILCVGRLEKQKGHKYLLQSFAISSYRSLGWRLIFVGDGILKNDLIVLAKELGIYDYVTFVGKQSDVYSWYFGSSIFAFPSTFEGFPNALAEAMSTGLPVVSFDCPTGPAELIENEVNGFLIPLYDTSAFAEKLNVLMSDEDLRYTIGERARCSTNLLDAKVITKAYFDFCRKVK
ncbi:glycosyltransferase family 4 protein [Providencia rettgeri]